MNFSNDSDHTHCCCVVIAFYYMCLFTIRDWYHWCNNYLIKAMGRRNDMFNNLQRFSDWVVWWCSAVSCQLTRIATFLALVQQALCKLHYFALWSPQFPSALLKKALSRVLLRSAFISCHGIKWKIHLMLFFSLKNNTNRKHHMTDLWCDNNVSAV